MGEVVNSEIMDEKELLKFVTENYHKVRTCDMYKSEYRECKSFKGRFQQYYVHGETLDCSKWKEDLDNCTKDERSKDRNYKSLAKIIQHENERLEKRMKAYQANDVWEKRSEPPPDWNAKLPDWLEKRQQYSFNIKPSIENQRLKIKWCSRRILVEQEEVQTVSVRLQMGTDARGKKWR